MGGTVPPSPCLHGRPTVGLSCIEFVYPGCWHFDNSAINKFNDVLLEHGGLPHVLPLGVHLNFFCWTSRGDHSKMFSLFGFCCGTPPSCLKVVGWWWVVVGGWWPGAI